MKGDEEGERRRVNVRRKRLNKRGEPGSELTSDTLSSCVTYLPVVFVQSRKAGEEMRHETAFHRNTEAACLPACLSD